MKIYIFLFAVSCSIFVLLLFYGILQKKIRPTKDLQQRIEDIRTINLMRAKREQREARGKRSRGTAKSATCHFSSVSSARSWTGSRGR